jgi:hypothetical protein
MAEITRSQLGQDSYGRYQKEVSYGTKVTNSMILLPLRDGDWMKSVSQMIENTNKISSRIKQLPDIGNKLRNGDLPMDLAYSLIGGLFNVAFGAASSAGPTDGTYIHTWLAPISGTSDGGSMTWQQAKGIGTGDSFDGVKIIGFTLSGSVGEKILLTLKTLGQGLTEGESRISTFSYPSEIPALMSHLTISATPNGGSATNYHASSFNFDFNFGYPDDYFKVGSDEIREPVFNTIPNATLTVELEADRAMVTDARAHKTYAIDLAFTSTENAAGSTKWLTEIEIPEALIDPETDIPVADDLLQISLPFTLYGGTTTGSGTDEVIAEFRVKDTTASYS